MFGIKKDNSADQSAAAKRLIENELVEMEGVTDGAHSESYIMGLARMALTLELITVSEELAYMQRAHDLAQKIKAKGEPVYKKKGVYEYIGYYIVKVANAGDGAANWNVQDSAGNTLAVGLTFKEAAKKIEGLAQ